MKNRDSISFCDPILSNFADDLHEAAKDRFKSLDAFNLDCKAVTKLLNKYAIPSFKGWVFQDENSWQLSWHEGTIVFNWPGNSEIAPDQAAPLYEGAASDRWDIMNECLLHLLMQEALNVVKIKAKQDEAMIAKLNQQA